VGTLKRRAYESIEKNGEGFVTGWSTLMKMAMNNATGPCLEPDESSPHPHTLFHLDPV
jgi:hypothetical protein